MPLRSISYLESHHLDGTEEPLRIYLTCYQILDHNHDPRIWHILHTVHKLLQEQVEKTKAGFIDSMDDDFNSAGALGYLFELVRVINQARDAGLEQDFRTVSWDGEPPRRKTTSIPSAVALGIHV